MNGAEYAYTAQWRIRGVTLAERLVIAAYCDSVDDRLSAALHSETVAEMVGITVRSVERIKSRLVKRGVFVPCGGDEGGRGRLRRFRLNFPAEDLK